MGSHVKNGYLCQDAVYIRPRQNPVCIRPLRIIIIEDYAYSLSSLHMRHTHLGRFVTMYSILRYITCQYL